MFTECLYFGRCDQHDKYFHEIFNVIQNDIVVSTL